MRLRLNPARFSATAALSRASSPGPYSIPEVMVFLAGLGGMPLAKFTIALTVGSVPVGFAFAAVGAGWADQPIVALVVSYVVPLLLLPIALHVMRLRRS